MVSSFQRHRFLVFLCDNNYEVLKLDNMWPGWKVEDSLLEITWRHLNRDPFRFDDESFVLLTLIWIFSASYLAICKGEFSVWADTLCRDRKVFTQTMAIFLRVNGWCGMESMPWRRKGICHMGYSSRLQCKMHSIIKDRKYP